MLSDVTNVWPPGRLDGDFSDLILSGIKKGTSSDILAGSQERVVVTRLCLVSKHDPDSYLPQSLICRVRQLVETSAM